MSSPPALLVDSHCHLDFPEFAEDFAAMLDRARAAGIGTLVTICTHLSRFERVAAIAAAHDHIYCSVGVHPHVAEAEGPAGPEVLLDHARSPRVVGIGETGLDYHYEHSPRTDQRRSFRAHIAAARESGLPLIVHTREADADTAAILREESRNGAFSGLIHCFSTSPQFAEIALELGFYISFSGILTFKAAEDVRAVARAVPLDRMLVETDAPYLAPIPKRGRRNEPAFVAHTAAVLAEIKGIDPAALARATSDNFFRLFTRATPPEAYA